MIALAGYDRCLFKSSATGCGHSLKDAPLYHETNPHLQIGIVTDIPGRISPAWQSPPPISSYHSIGSPGLLSISAI